MSAKIIAKTGLDKTLILDTRQTLIQPFSAAGWLDLRFAAWLSITNSTADDDTTGVAETLTYVNSQDRVWIGFKNNSNDTLPGNSGVYFAGLASDWSDNHVSQSSPAPTVTETWWTAFAAGSSQPVYAWNFAGSSGPNGDNSATYSNFGLSVPVQPTGTTTRTATNGYAVLLRFRLSRANTSAAHALMYQSSAGIEAGQTGGPILTSNPTINSLRQHLRGTWGSSQAGGSAYGTNFDSLVFYWPYNNSRLRIHSFVVEKFA